MDQEQQQGSEQQEGQQQDGQQQKAEETVTLSKAELDRRFAKARKNAAHEAEARIRREYAQRQQPQGEQRREPEKQAELKEPKREDYQDYESYADARAEYFGKKSAREERERLSKEESERKAEESQKARAKEFKKHADALIDEIPDFADAIRDAVDVQISGAMSEVISDAGAMGPRLLYYLVKNPDVAERIADMTVVKQGATDAEIRAAIRMAARELGKIESKLEAEIEAKKKAKPKEGEEQQEEEQQEDRSEERGEQQGERDEGGRFKAQEKGSRRAPEPIEPGTGRSANQDRGPSDKDTDSGWYAKRLAEERAARDRQRRK